MVAGGLAIIYLLPRLTRAIPSPLIAIVVLTALSMMLGLDIRTVGDMGQLPTSLPMFLIPDIPLNFETLAIIFPLLGDADGGGTAGIPDDGDHR